MKKHGKWTLVISIVLSVVCFVVGMVYGAEKMYKLSRIVLILVSVISIYETFMWLTGDSAKRVVDYRNSINFTFAGSLFPTATMAYGYYKVASWKKFLMSTSEAAANGTGWVADKTDWIPFIGFLTSKVAESTNNVYQEQQEAYAQFTSTNFMLSLLIPLFVVAVCFVLVNFGHKFKLKGAAKLEGRVKALQSGQPKKVVSRKEVSYAGSSGKSLSTVQRNVQTVSESYTPADTTSHVAALNEMKQTLEERSARNKS